MQNPANKNPLHKTLNDWLSWQETLHPRAIDLGLERIRVVYQRLFPEGVAFKVITVAGTNGKGSTLAFMEHIYYQAGISVGKFSSPHLHHYNERFAINTTLASEAQICTAFAQIEKERGGVSLTYFEYSTLAALLLFTRANVAIALLEVGLGGRLDSVNVVDSDVCIITSIALDHTQYLGNTLAQIGREKAGVMRAHRPCICGGASPPDSIQQVAREIHAELHFTHAKYTGAINLKGTHQAFNATLAIQAIAQLQDYLPITQTHVQQGIKSAQLSGRFEQFEHNHQTFIFDVAHNPASVRALADTLTDTIAKENDTPTVAIFGALKDKHIAQMIEAIEAQIQHWHLVPLTTERGMPTHAIAPFLNPAKTTQHINMQRAIAACQTDNHQTNNNTARVLVFGSFHTVADARRVLGCVSLENTTE